MSNKRKKVDISEQQRLTKLWPLLSKKMLKQLSEGHTQTIEALSELFPASKFPAPQKTHHCVVCHRSYDPRIPGKCVMEHQCDGNEERECPDYEGSWWNIECANCHKTFRGKGAEDEVPDDLVTGYCYSGPHTSDLSVVQGWGDELYDDPCEECEKLKQQRAAKKNSKKRTVVEISD